MTMFLPGYDAWKSHDPSLDWDGDAEEGCTCRDGMKAAKNCPLHGQDPDEAYERMRDGDY
jgi:hypothetical protein